MDSFGQNCAPLLTELELMCYEAPGRRSVRMELLIVQVLTAAECTAKWRCHYRIIMQGGSNMTGTDLYVNKPHCAEAVRP